MLNIPDVCCLIYSCCMLYIVGPNLFLMCAARFIIDGKA